MKSLLFLFIVSFLFAFNSYAQLTEQLIFDVQEEHTHGSTIVELPSGDLLAAWFQGHGERWADDVRIMGARLQQGMTEWTEPFLMADVPDFPDVNPVLFLDPDERLWLVWYTVIANQWETSLPKYRISEDYMQEDGPPVWSWQDVLYVKPGDLAEYGIQPDDRFVASVERQAKTYRDYLRAEGAAENQIDRWEAYSNMILSKALGEDMVRRGRLLKSDGSYTQQQMGYAYFRRMGWQTKNKAVFSGDRLILPLYSDGFSFSLMAITDDGGAHWKFSEPLVGAGNIQPAIAKKRDGTLVAYMRDNGQPPKRHPVSQSSDAGLSWSPVRDSDLPNEGSGSDIVTLDNGHWVLAYNDTEEGRHSLAVSLSTDEGETWAYTRHLEQDLREDVGMRTTGAYPAIIQGRDGRIHVTYSYSKKDEPRGEAIKYRSITEAWIMDSSNRQ